MDYFEYHGERIPYRMETSNRKTISIRVNHEGIIVRAPKTLSKGKIEALVETKANWIAAKYHEMQAAKPLIQPPDYREGSKFLYRGGVLALTYREGNRYGVKAGEGKVWIEQDQLNVALTDFSIGAIQNVLEQWYRHEARQRLEERVYYFSNRYDFGKRVNRIFIKDQKSRWGSCSSKCNLNFNYRLIMAPDEVLDYVVVHELCHLKHMNHSTDFWNTVGEIMPNYKSVRAWLRKHGGSLHLNK